MSAITVRYANKSDKEFIYQDKQLRDEVLGDIRKLSDTTGVDDDEYDALERH